MPAANQGPAQDPTGKAAQSLLEEVHFFAGESGRRAGPHARLVRRWELLSLWVAWAAAFSAALSSVTIIAGSKWVAAGLAITTAAASTFLASVRPAELAAKHRTASVGYEDIANALMSLSSEIHDFSTAEYLERERFDYESGQTYDAGSYVIVKSDPKGLARMKKAVGHEKAKYEKVKVDAPSLPEATHSHIRPQG